MSSWPACPPIVASRQVDLLTALYTRLDCGACDAAARLDNGPSVLHPGCCLYWCSGPGRVLVGGAGSGSGSMGCQRRWAPREPREGASLSRTSSSSSTSASSSSQLKQWIPPSSLAAVRQSPQQSAQQYGKAVQQRYSSTIYMYHSRLATVACTFLSKLPPAACRLIAGSAPFCGRWVSPTQSRPRSAPSSC